MGKHHKKNKDEKEHNKKSHKGDHKGDHKNKKSHKSKREASKGSQSQKEMGSLSGIASLKRSGDVKVLKGDGFEVIKSEFHLGPLNLEVTKTSSSKQKSVKVARAVTEKLKGQMVIKVKEDGSTIVKSVQFEKPKQVDVRGSLGLEAKESSNLVRRSVLRMRPVAAQRLLKVARTILKEKTEVVKS